MRKILLFVSMFLPWPARRALLQKQFGYVIHPTARIGLAWVAPTRLIMEEGTCIDHLTVCKNIDLLHLKAYSRIGRGNWITGFPLGPSPHFAEETDRQPQLIVGEHSAITHRHTIDCTATVTIGRFSTFAGFGSQLLTHSVDIERSRQTSATVRIGDYCFVGTDAVVLGGSALPDYCVLAAKSLLNKSFTETHHLYGGVPAQPIKPLPADWKYFTRTEGFVV
jgi:serine acetyltransferase